MRLPSTTRARELNIKSGHHFLKKLKMDVLQLVLFNLIYNMCYFVLKIINNVSVRYDIFFIITMKYTPNALLFKLAYIVKLN